MREDLVGIRLFVEVLDYAPDGLTWRERHVLSVLAENANDVTRECWPGIEDDPVIVRRMRLSGRSSRYAVLKALREKGALEGVSAGHRGRRAVYRIPVFHVGKGPGTADPTGGKGSGNCGPYGPVRVREPRTQLASKGPRTTDPYDEKGSENEFERVRELNRKGPRTTDPFPSIPSDSSASKRGTQPPTGPDYDIPETARPLVDGLTAARVIVRWPFTGNAWFPVLAAIQKSGVPAMIDHAVKAASRTDVESAKYFLRGWRELPPLPSPGTQRPPLRAVSGSYQPFQCPPESAYLDDQGF